MCLRRLQIHDVVLIRSNYLERKNNNNNKKKGETVGFTPHPRPHSRVSNVSESLACSAGGLAQAARVSAPRKIGGGGRDMGWGGRRINLDMFAEQSNI